MNDIPYNHDSCDRIPASAFHDIQHAESERKRNLRFSFLIREERRALGLTQTELGQMLGISPSYVSSIERGKRRASATLLARFHDTFQYSYDYLLGGAEIPQAFTVREASAPYGQAPRPVPSKLLSLVETCTKQEQETCYRLCQTYLLAQRSGSEATKET